MIYRVVHVSVEIGNETLDIDTELDDVQPRIATHQRVESPHNSVEILLQAPGALMLLDGHPDVLVSITIEDSDHVRVQMFMPAFAGAVSTNNSDASTNRAFASIGHAGISTRMRNGAQQIPLDLGSAIV